jgi:hypothetical protein
MYQDRLETLSPGKRDGLSTDELLHITSRLSDGERIVCSTSLTSRIRLEVCLGNNLDENIFARLDVWDPQQNMRHFFFSPYEDVGEVVHRPYPIITLEDIMNVFDLGSETRWRLQGYGRQAGTSL